MTDTYGQRLATLDPETGDYPTSRLGNAGNARSLVNRLKFEDESRMYRYTRIQGLMDGNPPWNSQKLTDLGQGHRANFNLRESEGMVEAAKQPYYDLVFEVPYFAGIKLDIPGAESHVVSQWEQWMQDEYTETILAWDGFDQNVQLHQWQMIVNGVGPLFWPHYIGWHSEAVKTRRVLVPQETKANVDELELAAVLHSYRADELDSFIQKGGSEDGKGDGWNIPLCKQAIIDSAQREMRQQWGIENYDLYQRAIRTGDLFYGIHRSDRIYVASIFVKEFGGKVSHYIITDSALGHNQENYGENLEEETGYLFKRRYKYNSFSQVLCPFFYDTGPDGTWHSVKGLGPKLYDFCDISNRTFCQMLDGAVIGSGLTIETQDANAMEETQIALVGGASVVSPGYKVVQTRIAESLQGAMAMRRELHNTLQSNTGSYRQRTEEEQREPTLGQAQLNYQTQALLTKGGTNRYYNNFNKWHRENLRRLLDPAQSKAIPGGEEALEFVARCIMRGVPPEVLKFQNIRKVTATRSIGYGSPQLRDMATKEMVQLIPYMDEVGRNHALRARGTALPGIGMSEIDSFFPPIEKTGVPNAHTSLAVLENNALRTLNGKAMVEPQQNHSIHFDVHMQDLQGHQQEPTVTPVDMLTHLHQAGPHLAKHLNFLKGDPTRKNEVKQKAQALNQMAKMTDKLDQQVREMHQAQQKQMAQNGQPPAAGDMESMIKAGKMRGELALKAEKQRGDMAIKMRSHQLKETLADKKTAADIQRENMRAAAQTRSMSQKSAADAILAAREMAAEKGMEARAQAHEHGLDIQKQRHDAALAARQQNIDAQLAAREQAQRSPEEPSE